MISARKLLDRLIEPSPAITHAYQRRQAQALLTLILLFLGFVVFAIIPMGFLRDRSTNFNYWLILTLSLLHNIFSFALAKTSHTRAASYYMIYGLLLHILIALLFPPLGSPNFTLLIMFAVPILLASILLDIRNMVQITALCIVGLVLVHLKFPDLPLGEVIVSQSFAVVFVALSMMVVVRFDLTILKQHQLDLFASEDRYRQLVELSPDGIVVYDRSGILYANPAALRLMEVEGSPEKLDLRNFVNPRAGQSAQERVDDLLASGLRLQEEEPLTTFKGKRLVVEVTSAPIVYRGQPARQGIIRDITERSVLNEKQQELQAKQERMKVLQTFIDDVSHDLKAPLSVMNTKTYLLRRLGLSPEQDRHFEILETQIKRMQDLIGNMLAIRGLDETPSQLELEEHSLALIVDEVYANFEPLAREKAIHFIKEVASNLTSLPLNQTELGRALGNLVDNAIHYTPAKGSVTLRVYQEDQRIVCEIQDSGIGIAAGDLERIFDRFYRSAGARNLQPNGTGLGLAITQKIIEAHGGKIEVSSEMGKGSLFRVVLPVEA